MIGAQGVSLAGGIVSWVHARRPFLIMADVAANARRKAQGKTTSVISPLAPEAVRRIDSGYVTVGLNQRFEVSSRIKEEFEKRSPSLAFVATGCCYEPTCTSYPKSRHEPENPDGNLAPEQALLALEGEAEPPQGASVGIDLGSRKQAMDLSSLASLGKIAGLGGIAIGAVVLLIRPIIDRVSSVPTAARAPMLRFVAMGAFGVGALEIVAWLVSGLSVGNVNADRGGVAIKGDITNSTVTTGATPGAAAPPVGTPAAKLPP
jgi:hypothetical protein